MRRSNEIREQMLKMTQGIYEGVDDVSIDTITTGVGIGIMTMLTEIACQLADMNERES